MPENFRCGGRFALSLLVVGLILAVAYLVLDALRVSRLRWTLVVSGIAAGMAISLLISK